MIKAIIFDWGGVLIDKPTPAMLSYCAKSLGISKKLFTKFYRKFEVEFHRGLSEKKLWNRVCKELKVQKPHMYSLWKDAFQNAYSPKKEMFSLASTLHENDYKIALLSNTETSAMEYFHEQNYSMFDVTVFSCAEGIVKPEKEIYKITLERLKVKPHEAILIDDKLDYIEGAKKIGIKGILFKNPNQVKKELISFSVRI